ncbi:STAS domain-containing protein [Streptomyces longwoodensis]|uniref:STAS domain-containing protein n=1 Tax=Streptomyces longwoodensis TaxID=68231 RepID=UPI0033D59545
MTSHRHTPESRTGLDVRTGRPTPTSRLIVVSGALDRGTRDRFDRVARAVLAERPATVLVGLSGTGFIDSSGVTSLINAYRAARRTGVRLALVAPSEPVARILALTGVDQVIDSYPTSEAALRA